MKCGIYGVSGELKPGELVDLLNDQKIIQVKIKTLENIEGTRIRFVTDADNMGEYDTETQKGFLNLPDSRPDI